MTERIRVEACDWSRFRMKQYLKEHGVKYITSIITLREDHMTKVVEKTIFVTDKGEFEFYCERPRKRLKIRLD